ncbi:MAG: hypothetical protein L6Q71_00645 [Planctomycetes bacterium]|nr:hypothetical protein [Planctomycetota bacterium]NUQ35639.1 hypothetical protein [Planctomycetaceae bacterium]
MILEAGDSFSTIASVVFLTGGVAMLVFTLWHSLKKSEKREREMTNPVMREEQYWQRMQQAVDTLDRLANEIDGRAHERSETLTRLTQEAAATAERLQQAIEKTQSAAADAKGEGRIVDFKSATEALTSRAHRKVYDAFDKGMSIQEIGRETGLQLGEIELILALRDKTSGRAGTA